MDFSEMIIQAIEAEKESKPQKSLSFIYDTIEPMLRDGRFTECDDFLLSVDISSLSVNIILGILSCTFPGMHRLPSRKSLMKRARVRFLELGRDADSLLNGLKRWQRIDGSSN